MKITNYWYSSSDYTYHVVLEDDAHMHDLTSHSWLSPEYALSSLIFKTKDQIKNVSNLKDPVLRLFLESLNGNLVTIESDPSGYITSDNEGRHINIYLLIFAELLYQLVYRIDHRNIKNISKERAESFVKALITNFNNNYKTLLELDSIVWNDPCDRRFTTKDKSYKVSRMSMINTRLLQVVTIFEDKLSDDTITEVFDTIKDLFINSSKYIETESYNEMHYLAWILRNFKRRLSKKLTLELFMQLCIDVSSSSSIYIDFMNCTLKYIYGYNADYFSASNSLNTTRKFILDFKKLKPNESLILDILKETANLQKFLDSSIIAFKKTKNYTPIKFGYATSPDTFKWLSYEEKILKAILPIGFKTENFELEFDENGPTKTEAKFISYLIEDDCISCIGLSFILGLSEERKTELKSEISFAISLFIRNNNRNKTFWYTLGKILYDNDGKTISNKVLIDLIVDGIKVVDETNKVQEYKRVLKFMDNVPELRSAIDWTQFSKKFKKLYMESKF